MRIARTDLFARAATVGLATLAFGLAGPSEAAAAPTSTGWMLEAAPGTKPSAGRGYRLLNTYNKLWVDVRAGRTPSLVASVSPVDSVEIVRAKGGDVRCGEPFTLRVAGHTLALDPKLGKVVPSTKPTADEWKFLGCPSGAPVPLGRPLALVNVNRGDAWVGCKHLGAANYCWDDKQLMGIATE